MCFSKIEIPPLVFRNMLIQAGGMQTDGPCRRSLEENCTMKRYCPFRLIIVNNESELGTANTNGSVARFTSKKAHKICLAFFYCNLISKLRRVYTKHIHSPLGFEKLPETSSYFCLFIFLPTPKLIKNMNMKIFSMRKIFLRKIFLKIKYQSLCKVVSSYVMF